MSEIEENELVAEIYLTVHRLNRLMGDAAQRGLRTDVTAQQFQTRNAQYGRVTVTVRYRHRSQTNKTTTRNKGDIDATRHRTSC